MHMFAACVLQTRSKTDPARVCMHLFFSSVGIVVLHQIGRIGPEVIVIISSTTLP